MQKIKVFVTTNFSCNYSCEYCYLGKLRSSTRVIKTDKLDQQLKAISFVKEIEEIVIAGGETTLLPMETIKKIIFVCKQYTDNISFVTNFSDIKKAEEIYKLVGSLSVSLNRERTDYEKTVQRLLSTELENISLSIVVTPSVIRMSADEIIRELELFARPALLLRYSPSIYNKIDYNISNKDYEVFLRTLIKTYLEKPRNFILLNIEEIERCLQKQEEPWKESCIFIDPYNRFSSLDYNHGREYFKTYISFIDFLNDSQKEKEYFVGICDQCHYFNHCYAEHMKEWDKEDRCCGMKGLLNWYEKNIYQNNGKL